jgi:RND family efflux transporter MFP subunit
VSDLKQQLEALRIDQEHGRPRHWRVLGLAALVLIAIATLVLWRSRDALAAVEVETARPTMDEAGHATQEAPILTATGYVVARRKAVVSAKIQGRLQELRVEEGDRVKEGGIIARLESQEYEAQVARARANVGSMRSQVARAEAAIARAEADLAEARRQLAMRDKLVAERVASTDERDAARSRVEIAEAALQQTRAERQQALADVATSQAEVRLNEALLQNTVIRAPFTGTVVKKMAEVGESVAPIPPGVNISTASGAIVALADLDTLEAEVDVAESNVARLQPDQPAEVSVEAFPDTKYRAVLRQVIPTADRTKATVLVKVTILDKDEKLKPEMSARVTFLEFPRPSEPNAAATPVVTVPQQAVVRRNGQDQVFVVVGEQARARPVRVGAPQRDHVVIAGGLSGSELLIVGPPADLEDGDPVRVKAQ